MNNEPVAWMVERTTGTKGYGDTPYVTLLDATKSTYWIENKIPEGYTVIPLYTHPVKDLTLTDEEWIITYQTWALTSNDPLVLKQAILRKASEK